MAILQVPVTKGGGTVEIDTDTLSEEVYAEVVAQGLKVLVNRGTSKITKAGFKSTEEYHAAGMAQAAKQVEAMKDGTILKGRKKAKGASGPVMTEARRLAKNLVKDEMKRNGLKISHYPASEITKAANALLETMPELVAQAEANLEERSKIKATVDVKSLMTASPELVAAAEAKKKKGEPLSATQAGKVAPRTKPSEATAH